MRASRSREVRGVVADVVGERAQADLGDAGDDGVEEEAIVRDEDDCVRVVREVLLEPVARLEIEMVGRLVEQEQPRTAEQQLGERDAHLPAARKRLAGFRRCPPAVNPRPRSTVEIFRSML